ncbi:hypothetical protein M3_0175 [Lysinibacillus phage vB_LfM_LysYB1]|nr:hypothetical protein M3_0175 [Lysinibacillus phage vB_LfM_LysYB1]
MNRWPAISSGHCSAKYTNKEEQKVKNSKRITENSGQFSKDVNNFTPRHHEAVYYQVSVGNFGVMLPQNLNLDTLEGLQLVADKATRIESRDLAQRIAESAGGKVWTVTETFVRTVTAQEMGKLQA